MNSDRPYISVIVPAYNAAAFLGEAIQSIQQQGYEFLEIIVIDDGSTDDTAAIARSFGDRIRYLYQENSGPACARNTGLKMAKGEIIAFLDADDLWPENKLEIQLDYFLKNPALEVVVGRVQYLLIEEDRRVFQEFSQPALGVNLGAGLYQKSLFDKLGYFDSSMQQSEDVDWLMRIRENRVPMAAIDAVTLYYRIHGNNMTRDRDRQNTLFIKALKQSLDRRRKVEGTAKSLPNVFNEKSLT
jgi:glycosyltransferase involved in cell wall biosynthesis